MGDKKTRVFLIKGVLGPKSNPFALWDIGEFGEEEKALNLKDIVVDKPIVGIHICEFQAGDLTFLKMALMILWRMVSH